MTTIVSILDQAASRFGERTAVVAIRGLRTRRWSYRELESSSRQVASFLWGAGLNRGDYVVLRAPNSPEWVAVYFGCLRAGVVLVPLDVSCSPEFATRIASKVRPAAAFISASAATGSPVLADRTFFVENVFDQAARSAGLEPGESKTPDPADSHTPAPADVAELVFTSGTTGEPKGVILTHDNIVANVEAAALAVPPRPEYRLLSLLPLSHMFEQTVGLLAPMTAGARIVFPASRQPATVFKTIADERVTTVTVVPEILRLFWEGIEREARKRGRERSFRNIRSLAGRLPLSVRRQLFRGVHRTLGGRLRFFMCGGARLDPELARSWESLGIVVLQGYGTTEASPIVTTNTFGDRTFDSVGRVLPGQELRIAEDGEVQIRGRNVTAGYWQDPGATEAAFDGEWYRTGDLGSLDGDRRLRLHGRKKDMIVLDSGLNVHAQDVEEALKAQAGINDAAVIGLPDSAGRTQVHAVVVLTDAAVGAMEAVRQANSMLADHQRIRGVTVWPFEDFPRTHTLKVRKQEIIDYLTGHGGAPPMSAPGAAVGTLSINAGSSSAPLAAGSTTYPPADSSLDASASASVGLNRLIASVARVPADQVTPDATLEDGLGLDSLGRVELLSMIESELGAYIDEGSVGAATTVEELGRAAAVRQAASSEKRIPTWPLHPAIGGLRNVAQTALLPQIARLTRLEVTGLEHLEEIDGPVLFAANHQSHLDTAFVLAGLPATIRRRVAVAAAADYWFDAGRIRAVLAGTLFNGFPFSRSGAVKRTLRHCARLLDEGWSVLVFPEGTRSVDGLMSNFKSGTGLMAVELGVPVVPVRIAGSGQVLPKGQWRPRPGRVFVRFGAPWRAPRGVTPAAAAAGIQMAVESLNTTGPIDDRQPVHQT